MNREGSSGPLTELLVGELLGVFSVSPSWVCVMCLIMSPAATSKWIGMIREIPADECERQMCCFPQYSIVV